MGYHFRFFLALVCVAVTGFAAPVHAQNLSSDRLALVIGNSAYRTAPLFNPQNDAKAMSSLLRSAGFAVEQHIDTSLEQLQKAVATFGQKLQDPKVKFAVFYYAGHGVQLDWRNYLVPVTAAIRSADDVRTQTVDMSNLLKHMGEAKNKNYIIILDACRDDPFAGAYRAPAKGLSQFDAPVGSVLAYSTSPGKVALDGEGSNGLYTAYLLKEFAVKGVKIEDAFKRTRLNVRLASNGAQIPWETTSLEEDLYLFPESRPHLSDAEQDKLLERELQAWTKVKSTNDFLALAEFIRVYPSGSVSELAASRMNRLLALQNQRELRALQAKSASLQAAELERFSSDTALKVAVEKAEATRVEATKAEAQRVELAKAEAVREETLRVEAALAEAAREVAVRQEAARTEAVRVAAALLEATRIIAQKAQEAQVEAMRAAAKRVQATAQETAARMAQLQADQVKAEQVRIEQAQAEIARITASKVEAQRQEAARLDIARAEAARQEALLITQAAQEESNRVQAQRLVIEQQLEQKLAAERDQTLRLAQARAVAERTQAVLLENARVALAAEQTARAQAEVARVALAAARQREGAANADQAGAGSLPAMPVMTEAVLLASASELLASTPFFGGSTEHLRRYSVGDQFKFRVIDLYNKSEIPLEMAVTGLDLTTDQVQFNQGQYVSDLMGNILTNLRGVSSTPRQFYPAEIVVGKRWRTQFKQVRAAQGVTYTFRYDLRVVGKERVTVPAGSFDTYKIEARGYNMELGARLERNIWIAPGINADIAHETFVRLSNGHIEQHDRQELVSFKQKALLPSSTLANR